MRELRAEKVALVATEQPVDAMTAAGQAFLDILAGVARAKERGVYEGRKPSLDADRVRALHAQGMDPMAIAEA